MENERSLHSQNEKRSKMQNFMNNTKMNASKIYRQQQQKKEESVNVKKVMLEKQKELKSKYTIVEKRREEPRQINVEPTKVDWRKVDETCKGISVPV